MALRGGLELHLPAGASGIAAGWHEREWLLTDGCGGYACGTVLDLPTRRYHALLCTLPEGGTRRVRLLAGVEERADGAAGAAPVGAFHWAALPAPSVPALERAFRPHPLPTWVLRGPGLALERALAMPRGRPAVVVHWRNLGSLPLRLRVRPLLAGEDADELRRERPVEAGVRRQGGALGWALVPGQPVLWLTTDGPVRYDHDPVWYRDFLFAVDRARGYDAVGDRFAPGVLTLDLEPGGSAAAAFAAGAPLPRPAHAFAAERAARAARSAWADADPVPLAARLAHGVDDFFFATGSARQGVLAGFPWFGEWGRDTFVALPGLTLAVGEPARCEAVLRGALPFLRNGLLPNVYGRGPADSDYGSADAALWFALAVQRWQDAGAGPAAARDAFGEALLSVADACLRGTELGLRVDAEGLLCAGAPDRNATWMDARTADGPVTPRDGQPVEIVALWCSLLAHLGELYGEPWRGRAGATGEAFVRRFWRPEAGCLCDRRSGGVCDAAVRPNMVVAAALPRSPLTRAQRQGIVGVADAELRTPRGLRTLSPRARGYRGRYEGTPAERDGAYHQGTAWPWLCGFHVEAALRAAAPAELPARRALLRAWLDGFLPEVDRAGIDHVSEVFDGDPPQRPGGAFAQAWNTGELLRALALCARGSEPPARSGPP